MSQPQDPTTDQVFRSAMTLSTQLNNLFEHYDRRIRQQEAQISGLMKKISELEPNLKKK